MATLLRLIWFDFTDVIWRNRNEIAHERENNVRQMENTTWANKLLWYLENRHVIARRDQFFINYMAEDIETIPGLTRRKMVQNLERLEAAYAREVQLLILGQRTITSYFSHATTQEDKKVETASSERPSAAHSACYKHKQVSQEHILHVTRLDFRKGAPPLCWEGNCQQCLVRSQNPPFSTLCRIIYLPSIIITSHHTLFHSSMK